MLERLDQENIERLNAMAGPIKHPSGLHFFSVELRSRIHERIDHPVVFKDRRWRINNASHDRQSTYFQNEEGAVYTSLRPEEAAVVTRETYRNWLVRASQGMLERMEMQEKSISLEKTTEALAAAGISENMREGLLLANETLRRNRRRTISAEYHERIGYC